MRMKYQVFSHYLKRPIKTKELLYDHGECKTFHQIVEVIYFQLKEEPYFASAFEPKKQYICEFKENAGYTVSEYGDKVITDCFSDSLRSYLNRVFTKKLILTESSVRQINFFVYNSGDKLLIMDSAPRDPYKSIRFTIRLSLVKDDK